MKQQLLLHLANGLVTDEGEEINKEYSKDWRERLFENLPYKAEDIMFVNLPPKVDDNMKKAKKMTLEQIMMAIDDL